MPVIVGTDQSLVRRCTCKRCTSIIEYTPNECEEYSKKDYTGSTDTYTYIRCPKCGHNVILGIK